MYAPLCNYLAKNAISCLYLLKKGYFYSKIMFFFIFQPFRVHISKSNTSLKLYKILFANFFSLCKKNVCFIKIWVEAWFYKNVKKLTFFNQFLDTRSMNWRGKKEPILILKIIEGLLSKKIAKCAIPWLYMLKKGHFTQT